MELHVRFDVSVRNQILSVGQCRSLNGIIDEHAIYLLILIFNLTRTFCLRILDVDVGKYDEARRTRMQDSQD